MTPELSIVIPAYNESKRIVPTLVAVVSYLTQHHPNAEVIVVDDGSADGTSALIQEFAGQSEIPVRLIANPKNRGKGAALRDGVLQTRGVRVLTMDADLATPMSELDTLLVVLEQGSRVVIGSRAVGNSNILRRQSALREKLGKLGNLWIQLWAAPGIQDTQCGFKLFDGELARALFARAREQKFGTDIEILALAHYCFGEKVSEVGIRWQHQEGSKVGWSDYFDVLLSVPRIALSARWLGKRKPSSVANETV